ncbi:MAG: chromate efflux transporter [Actinomycetota bacterium]
MTPVPEIVRRFLRLGILGFGGPAAHIAMMRDEFVVREKWFDDAEFARMVGAVNLIPGPNSTELAMHIGQRRAGGRGLVAAGLSFIVPAVLIVGVIAWLHERHGTDPAVVDIRWGVLPVVVAIVAHATWGLARTSIVSMLPFLVASVAMAAHLAGANELAVLAAAGVIGAVQGTIGDRRGVSLAPLAVVLGAATHPSLWRILAVFLEIGAVLYGSGYVLVAFLQGRIVDELGWLDATSVLDAVAIGQITPGPVFSTATFVGWDLAGPWGAVAATVGIFLPSFVLVAFLGRIIGWLESRGAGRAFLAAVVAASLGLMAGALIRIADAALVDAGTALIALAAFAALLARVPTTRVVLAGVVIGAVRLLVG